MLTTLFFVITDFKTIKVPVPVVPAETDLLAELIYFVGLVAPVFAVVIFAVWLWQRPTRPTVAKPEYWMLVDGSNVMHWQDNAPSLHPVREVVEKLTGLGYVPGIVFDANAGWKLLGRYLHDGELARLLGVEDRQVLVVPKGTQADPYLLETAREFEANLVASGYQVSRTIGPNGAVTLLTNGGKRYAIYTATSTGESSAQVTLAGQKLSKIRLTP